MMIFQILTALILVLGLVVWSAHAQDGNARKNENQSVVTSKLVQGMSREDIQKALKKIETTAPPTEGTFAMCYEITISDEIPIYTYHCPIDGEKTVYSQKSKAYKTVEDIAQMENLVKELGSLSRDISFSLDEKKLCSKCFPKIPDRERNVSLVINFSDGRVVRTDNVNTNDIRYLIGFFTDGLTYQDENDNPAPLKSVDPRLKELLGEK